MANPPMQPLQDAALEAVSLIRDEVETLFVRHESQTPDIMRTLKMLFWYLSSRSQAVFFLLSYGYAWDAEIVLRSFYDSAAKILLFCLSDDSEKANLLDEFWNKLGTINNRKMARRAAFANKVFGPTRLSGTIFKALQDTSLFPVEDDANRAERKRIEQKWSFTEIVERLSRSDKRLSGITSILHMYGMASHLTHADSAAMDLMTDRSLREPEERKLLEAGQASRIVTDQVSLWWFCADALRRHCKSEFVDGQRLREAFERVIELGKPFQEAFEASQRDFYAARGYQDSGA